MRRLACLFALIKAYRALIARGREDGSVRAVDLDRTILITPGASNWLIKGMLDEDESRHARVAAEIADLLCLGLLAHPG